MIVLRDETKNGLHEVETILESVEIEQNGETRKVELRQLILGDEEFLSIWFAGDKTGEFVRQLESKNTQSVRDQFDKMRQHFSV